MVLAINALRARHIQELVSRGRLQTPLNRAQQRFLQRVAHYRLGQSGSSNLLRPGYLRRQGYTFRHCSSNGGPQKRPVRGFEKFYEKEARTPAEAEAQKSEASKSEPPSEGPQKDVPKAEPQKTRESKESSGKGPSEHTTGSKKSSSGKDSKSSDPLGMGGMGGPSQMNRQWGGIAAGIAAYLLYSSMNSTEKPEITLQELMKEYLVKGYVEKIQIINQSSCRVHLRPDTPNVAVDGEGNKILRIQLGTPESFETKIEQLQAHLGLQPLDYVPIQYVSEVDYMDEMFRLLPPALLILLPLLFAARAMSSGFGPGGSGGPGGGPGGRNIFSLGKAFPAGKKDLKSKIKFSDVAGQAQAKKEVTEFVDFLKDPTKFEALGAKIPKGGLLVGPPGTGKTLLAKAVAGEANCPFYSMSGSDFIEMFVGVGPSRVRDLFQQARSTSPSIIFIDEIDAVGRKRGKGGFSGGGNDERENTLNQMLVEMDGFTSGTGVVVLAGTNRADILDPALTRPGRFDRTISIDKPDLPDRKEIFMVHLKPLKLGEELGIESVAQRMAALTPGFAGSDIANICNEAAIFAARRDSSTVDMVDFERATERVIGGLAKNNNLMGQKEKKTVALHESGHALAGWFLQHADPLLKVSIVPRSNGALGFAQYLPEELALYSKEAVLDKMAVALGGRAAEELFVGHISTGASDDLDKVTKMAYAMVTVYGMNDEIGLVSYSQNNPGEQFYKPYSERTGMKIDAEARALIDTQYERVKALLSEKQDLIIQLSDKLFEKETLVYSDLKEVLGDRPWDVKKEYAKFVTATGSPFEIAEDERKEENKPPSERNEEGTEDKQSSDEAAKQSEEIRAS